MCNEQVAEQDEIADLDAAFFADAIVTRPGENIIEVVARERELEHSSSRDDDGCGQ